MLSAFDAVHDDLEACVSGLDVACIDGEVAQRLVKLCGRIERLAVGAKTLAMGRVEQTGVWASTGAKSSADWLATFEGSPIRAAIETVAVAKAIEDLPATEQSLRSGQLSIAQAVQVTSAALADPGSESMLLSAAKQSYGDLQREARRVRVAANSGETHAALAKRQPALRSLQFSNDENGMTCARLLLEPKFGIAFRRQIERDANRLFDAARRQGVRDSTEQYAVDAFMAIFETATTATSIVVSESAMPENSATASARAGRHVDVSVVIDFEALLRGELESGERCEIAGIGPIPVSLAREYLLGGAFLKVILAKGVDIRNVCHVGRYVPTELKTALKYRDPTCVVTGCNRTKGLEDHHVAAFAKGGQTSLFNLRRICGHDHHRITNDGYALGPPDQNGKCQLIPPRGKPPDL